MKETGLMFKAPLVRAILADQKLMTRRIADLPHMNPLGEWQQTTVGGPGGGRTRDGKEVPLQVAIGHTRTGEIICAPIQAGDRIYVRETYAHGIHAMAAARDEDGPFVYAADGKQAERGRLGDRWKPSIHMPKHAARIWLEVTGVHAERLHDISDADCWAEGAIACARPDQFSDQSVLGIDGKAYLSPRSAFRALWESTGARWDDNPWLWVYDFKRIASPAAPAETQQCATA